jgi:hypothetical protein
MKLMATTLSIVYPKTQTTNKLGRQGMIMKGKRYRIQINNMHVYITTHLSKIWVHYDQGHLSLPT